MRKISLKCLEMTSDMVTVACNVLFGVLRKRHRGTVYSPRSFSDLIFPVASLDISIQKVGGNVFILMLG